VSPDVAKTLDTIYDKTLSRTYVNDSGQRVMLSLAYGANQSRALQLHKPEVCYVAQGFRVTKLEKAEMQVGQSHLPVMKMVAVQGARNEPIIYWMRVGDDVARGWLEQNKVRLKYGLGGEIPDGLLFRVSNISTDVAESYSLQEDFVNALLRAVGERDRGVLIGALRAH
jgi:EpsI family protein